jgi:hypothetical protein
MRSVATLVKNGKTAIKLIDGYVDAITLALLSDKANGVSAEILTFARSATDSLKVHAATFNAQHGNLQIRTAQDFHDRFVIVDDTDFYHFGASIKDLGKKGFMFSRIEEPAVISILKDGLARTWATATVFV